MLLIMASVYQNVAYYGYKIRNLLCVGSLIKSSINNYLLFSLGWNGEGGLLL